jgi:predicted peptidase
MRKRFAITAAVFVATTPALFGGQTAQLFESESHLKVRVPYLLFHPSDYNEHPQRHWPLILYLHGGSLRGDNAERLRTVGLPRRLEQDQQFPFIVVAPLCREGEIWTDFDAFAQLLDHIVRTNRVDEERIYVTGHSMGGRGALYFAFKFSTRFAAVVAMSPLSPITAWAKHLCNVPVWIIHGAKDSDAPIKDSEELIRAIEQSRGRPKFTLLPDRDHFVLDLYDKNDVFDWMSEHHR